MHRPSRFLVFSRSLAALLVISLTLPACTSAQSWWSEMRGERSDDQFVDGPMRRPMLNPSTAQAAAEAEPAPQIAATPPPPPANAAADPYSYYDAAGQPQAASEPGMLDRMRGWVGLEEERPVAEARKPISGNRVLLYPDEQLPPPAATQEAPADMLLTEPPAATADTGSPYPPLASVPPTPDRLQEVQQQRAQQEQALMEEQAQAQAAQRQLEEQLAADQPESLLGQMSEDSVQTTPPLTIAAPPPSPADQIAESAPQFDLPVPQTQAHSSVAIESPPEPQQTLLPPPMEDVSTPPEPFEPAMEEEVSTEPHAEAPYQPALIPGVKLPAASAGQYIPESTYSSRRRAVQQRRTHF